MILLWLSQAALPVNGVRVRWLEQHVHQLLVLGLFWSLVNPIDDSDIALGSLCLIGLVGLAERRAVHLVAHLLDVADVLLPDGLIPIVVLQHLGISVFQRLEIVRVLSLALCYLKVILALSHVKVLDQLFQIFVSHSE